MSSSSGSSRSSSRRNSDSSDLQTTDTKATSVERQDFVGQGPEVADLDYPTDMSCEFRKLTGCNRVFSPDEIGVNEYTTHIEADHLKGRLPQQGVCLYCDDFVFNSQYRDWNLKCRMDHISSHFLNGDPGKPRADFWMLNHIRDNGIADRGDVTRAILSGNEGSNDPTFKPLGYRPPKTSKPIIDHKLDKAERSLRRQEERAQLDRRRQGDHVRI